jgi:hypothetical protein
VALCKSEETLRKFLQDRAYQEGEEGEVHFVFFEDFFEEGEESEDTLP